MKKIMITVFASLIAASLFANATNNWLRLESLGEDRTLAGALVPSGTVYNVMHDATTILSNATDEVGWYPESVAQVWDVAENAPFTNGVFKFVLFDNTHGAGAIVRYLAVSNVEQGVIMKLAADANAPYEIADASKLDGSALVVGANVTLDLASRRTGYTVKTTSEGTLLATVTDAEWNQYQAGETLELVPMSEAGTFAGTLKLVSPSGTSVAAENLAVIDDGSGGYVLQASGHEPYGPGYLDIPFKMTAINALSLAENGEFGGSDFSYSTNMTVAINDNYAHKAKSTASGLGGSSSYFWYTTTAGTCTFIKTDHYPAVNCQLTGKDASYYWQIDVPVDFGERTFNLGKVQAGYFLCNGSSNWQVENETRIVASTITVLDEDGATIGTLSEGQTADFGYQTVATNTMSAASAIELTGKVRLRLKVWLPVQSKNETYSGCTGIKLLEAREYTATISGNADFSDIIWTPSRLEATADDDLIISNATAGATLTFDETDNTIGTLHLAGARTVLATNGVSAAAFASIVAGPDTVFDYKGDENVSVPAGAKATIPGWTTPSKITGAGTLAFDAGTKDGAIADIWSSSFGTTGTNAVARGTWAFTTASYPSSKDILISGEDSVLSFATTKDISYNKGGTLTVEKGGSFKVSSRDTFNRELTLRDGGKMLFLQDNNNDGRSIDMYTNAKLNVTGSEPSVIGKIGDETSTSGSGIIAIRRSGFTVTVASGAELQCYSAWSTAAGYGGSFYKAGAGKMVQYRDSSSALPFVVSGGTLKYVNGGRTTTAGITLNDGCKLELSATDSGSYTLANVISGKGRIEKQDSGTYTLTGANTYEGTTTVKAGTLVVNAVSALGSTSGVTVNSGATLQMPLVEDETAFTIGGEGTLRLVMTEAQREQLGTITSGVKTTLSAANVTLVDAQGEAIDDREATIVDGKVRITLKGGYFIIAWNGSDWTNTEGVVTAPTDKSILVMKDGDFVSSYSTAVKPHMMILPESGLVKFSNQNNLGALAVDIPENTTLEFLSNAAYTGAISGSGTLKFNPGQHGYSGQSYLPSTLFTEFTGTLQLASGRMADNTASYNANMTLEILDGAQLYLTRDITWSCPIIAHGNGWTGESNTTARGGPLRSECNATLSASVTIENGEDVPNFVAWNSAKTCSVTGPVTATNGLNVTGNGGTLKLSAPFSMANIRGTVTLVGGNLTFGSGSAGSTSSEFRCGDKIVIETGRTFTLHTRTDSVVDTSVSNKAKFVTPIDLDGGTLHMEDGSYVFSGDVTVNSDSTMVFKWKKGRVFQSLKGSAVLNVQGTCNSNASEADGYAVFAGGDFSGTIRSTANATKAVNLYIVPIGQALAKATVDLQSNGKLKITEAATIGGLDGAKPITIDNGANTTQTLTIANGGTVSLLTDTEAAAVSSTANLDLSGTVIDLNVDATTPVAEDSTETYWLAKAPSITTNGVKMAKGTWAFTVDKVDGNDVLKAQKTAKGFYIIIADNKQVSHDDEAKSAVNIDRDWIKTATAKDDNPITDDSSEGEVETALNEKRANNVSLWENYVLGLEKDVSTSIPVVKPVQTTDADSVTFALGNVKVNDAAGANVTYKVLTCDTLGGEYVEASESVAHDKTVAVELPESGVKYYKFEVDVSGK